MSAGVRTRPSQRPQRKRLISMSETIAEVRRKRLISNSSAVEGDNLDQISRGSPGNFHPPLFTSREQINVQQRSSQPSTSREFRPVRQTSQSQLSSVSDLRTQQLEGNNGLNSTL